VGAQATSIVQLAPGGKGDEAEQVVRFTIKPAEAEALENFSAALPIFWMGAGFAALVLPTVVSGKANVGGWERGNSSILLFD